MPDRTRRMSRARALVAGAALLALTGCNLLIGTVDPPSIPTLTQPPATSEDAAWQVLAPGLERRTLDLQTASIGQQGTVVVIRADPAQVTFRVQYSPGAARSLSEWQALLPDALVIANGAFFDDADYALGLLVADGQTFGASFTGFGGMFQVTSTGVRVRSLVAEPYQGEALWQAVQAFPMLIEGGGVLAPQGDGFDQRARRTWIGQDRAGRILLGATQNWVTLADLQAWLLASGLDLDIAFGLDGGRSTGLLVAAPGLTETLPALDRLPSVIAIYGS